MLIFILQKDSFIMDSPKETSLFWFHLYAGKRQTTYPLPSTHRTQTHPIYFSRPPNPYSQQTNSPSETRSKERNARTSHTPNTPSCDFLSISSLEPSTCSSCSPRTEREKDSVWQETQREHTCTQDSSDASTFDLQFYPSTCGCEHTSNSQSAWTCTRRRMERDCFPPCPTPLLFRERRWSNYLLESDSLRNEDTLGNETLKKLRIFKSVRRFGDCWYGWSGWNEQLHW